MDVPASLGRYQLLEPIGRGAMGAVYKARDPAIDRVVAVKVLGHAVLAFPEHREEYLERFRREARAAGRLSHPNIVSVYDLAVDEATSTPYIVMEHVPGVSLATVLQENPVLPLDQALDIVRQIGLALEEAHRAGVVHRDVKPGNVLLDTRGRVKVADFGIARLPDSELTQTGVGLGTPGYLAPEVLRGAAADARADVFSLGVVAYQLVSGRRAFEGDTRDSLALQILQHEPAPPRQWRPEVPLHVSDAILRAIAKSPDQRSPSVSAFLAALRAEASPAPATQTSAEPPQAPRARSRTGRVLAGALLALAMLAAGVLLAARYWASGDAPAVATPQPTARPAAASRPRPAPTDAAPPATHPAVGVVREILSRAAKQADEKPEKRPSPGKGRGKGKPKKER